MPNNYLQN